MNDEPAHLWQITFLPEFFESQHLEIRIVSPYRQACRLADAIAKDEFGNEVAISMRKELL